MLRLSQSSANFTSFLWSIIYVLHGRCPLPTNYRFLHAHTIRNPRPSSSDYLSPDRDTSSVNLHKELPGILVWFSGKKLCDGVTVNCHIFLTGCARWSLLEFLQSFIRLSKTIMSRDVKGSRLLNMEVNMCEVSCQLKFQKWKLVYCIRFKFQKEFTDTVQRGKNILLKFQKELSYTVQKGKFIQLKFQKELSYTVQKGNLYSSCFRRKKLVYCIRLKFQKEFTDTVQTGKNILLKFQKELNYTVQKGKFILLKFQKELSYTVQKGKFIQLKFQK